MHARPSCASVLRALAFALAIGVVPSLASAASYSDKEAEEILGQAIALSAKSLPIMTDEITRLDAITPGPGMLVTYSFTLLVDSADEIDLSLLETAARELHEQTQKAPQFCSIMDFFVARNGVMAYRFATRKDEPIGEFRFPVDPC